VVSCQVCWVLCKSKVRCRVRGLALSNTLLRHHGGLNLCDGLYANGQRQKVPMMQVVAPTPAAQFSLQALRRPQRIKKTSSPVVQDLIALTQRRARFLDRSALQQCLLCVWLQHSSTTVHGQRFARCFAGLVSDLRSNCAQVRP